MIDWEEISKAEDIETLKEAKLWLFQEHVRLENAKKELEDMQDKFNKERSRFRDEMNLVNHRVVIERKRLKEENLFFDKKMAILQGGFSQLEADRRKLEQERKDFEQKRMLLEESPHSVLNGNIAQALFRNAHNPLALRKRYRDLVKIFHPDNFFGDEEMIQMINKEFARLKEEI